VSSTAFSLRQPVPLSLTSIIKNGPWYGDSYLFSVLTGAILNLLIVDVAKAVVGLVRRLPVIPKFNSVMLKCLMTNVIYLCESDDDDDDDNNDTDNNLVNRQNIIVNCDDEDILEDYNNDEEEQEDEDDDDDVDCWNRCLQMILADHERESAKRNLGCVLKAKTERAKSYVKTIRIETVKSRTD
jgi:hypothetical protein